MAPEPPHRHLLAKFLDSLKETTAHVVQEESNDRNGVHDARLPPSVLDARIHNLQKDEDMLEAAKSLIQVQRATLERQRARAHNAALPCYRIPDDILSYIFEVGVPAPSEQWSFNRRESDVTRWTLEDHQLRLQSVAAVCSRFRAILLNTPRCWTYVTHFIRDDAATSQSHKRTALDKTAAILSRSKGCRFSLEMEMGEWFLPSPFLLKTISSILSPHMHRCEQSFLTISGDVWDALLLVLPSPLSTSFQTLQHVSFVWHESDDIEARAPMGRRIMFLVNVNEAPLLSLCLDIKGCGSDDVAADFNRVQTHALVRLRLATTVDLQDIVKLLGRCVNLEHLYLESDSGFDSTSETYTLTLNSLISFQDYSHSMARMLLSAPQLEQLSLGAERVCDILDPRQPTLPSLRRFDLATGLPDYEDERLVSFVRRHPHIAEFDLWCPMYAEGHVPILSATIESFNPRPLNANAQTHHRPALHQLSIAGDPNYAKEISLASSLDSLMRELVDVQLWLRPWWTAAPIQELVRRFPTRITESEAHDGLSSTWPDAWGRWANY